MLAGSWRFSIAYWSHARSSSEGGLPTAIAVPLEQLQYPFTMAMAARVGAFTETFHRFSLELPPPPPSPSPRSLLLPLHLAARSICFFNVVMTSHQVLCLHPLSPVLLSNNITSTPASVHEREPRC